MNRCSSVDVVSYLFRSTFATTMPLVIAINVGDSSAFIHRVEGKEVYLSDSSPCL